MRFVFIIGSLMVGLFAAASIPEMDSLRVEKRVDGLFVIHQVEEQETLYSIARRYGSSVDHIIAYNQIQDNRIEIGQVIAVLLLEEKKSAVDEIPMVGDSSGFHWVKEGETLYSISKQYDVKVKELKKWNELQGNAISTGMPLQITPTMRMSEKEQVTDVHTPVDLEVETASSDPFEGFEKYLVQTGETLSSIAAKIGVRLDSLREWNNLRTDYLKIGQALLFKNADEALETSTVASSKGNVARIDEDGFERVYEEGTASVIESMSTSRYLALHRMLPIGTNLEVRNLMNNRIVHVKVVGKLPNTGLNKNLLLRLSKAAYDQLGILDSKSRVEVSYYKQ